MKAVTKATKGYFSYVAVDCSKCISNTEIHGFRQKTAANVQEITSDVISEIFKADAGSYISICPPLTV